MVSQETLSILHEKYQALVLFMDERVLRRWAAAEARSLGWGGASAVSKATGISRTTIQAGIAELHQPMPEPSPERIRRPGAGRPRLSQRDPRLLEDLQCLLEPVTRGDPEAPLLWTSKSTRHLAEDNSVSVHHYCFPGRERELPEGPAAGSVAAAPGGAIPASTPCRAGFGVIPSMTWPGVCGDGTSQTAG